MSNPFASALERILSLPIEAMGEYRPRTIAEALALQLVRDSFSDDELRRTIAQLALRLPREAKESVQVVIEGGSDD